MSTLVQLVADIAAGRIRLVDLTHTLSPDTRLQIGPEANEASLTAINADWMMSFGSDARLPVEQWQSMLDHLKHQGETTIGDLLKLYAGKEVQLWRTVGYLLKIDALRVKK